MAGTRAPGKFVVVCVDCGVDVPCRRRNRKRCLDCMNRRETGMKLGWWYANEEQEKAKRRKDGPMYRPRAAKKWAEKNPERHRELVARANVKRAEAKKAWDRSRPVHARMRVEKRRAIKLAAEGELTAEHWKSIVVIQGGLCFYCRRPKKLEQEHLVPLTRGGRHDSSNVVGACRSCNSQKRDKTPDEYYAWLR